MAQHDEYIGRTQDAEDTVWAHLIVRMAATLGLAPEELPGGGVALPPLWHWMLFQDWVPRDRVGHDGHPKRGGFLPALPELTRRMWAGGRVVFFDEIPVGADVLRRTTITAIEDKTGRSGRLVFVTLRHDISVGGAVVVTEEQDLVYRAAEAGGAAREEPAPPPPAGASVVEIAPDPVMLFRYSALTGNGHRIHYDEPYCRNEENYPGVIVHGPLQATLMAGLATAAAPGQRLRTFEFRGRRPAFVGGPMSVVASRDGDRVSLETRNAAGSICMSGVATLDSAD